MLSRRFAEASTKIVVALASSALSISSLMRATGSVRTWPEPRARMAESGRGWIGIGGARGEVARSGAGKTR